MQSVDQLRNRLAELMGWQLWNGIWGKTGRKGFTFPTPKIEHPVTLSLDWLAAHGLPEGWVWRQAEWGYDQCVFDASSAALQKRVSGGSQPTELLARLAACVAAWEKVKP